MPDAAHDPRARRWTLLVAGLLSVCAHAVTPSAAQLIAKFQAETVFYTQFDVADEIAKVANRNDLSPLVPWLTHADRHVRGNAAYLFAKLEDPRGFAVLVGILSDKSADRIYRPMIGDSRDVPPSERTPDEVAMQIRQDRYYAIHLLGELRKPRAVDVLVPLLDHDENNYKAAWALGEIGDVRAVPALITALSNQDALVRVCAIGALDTMHAREALPHLAALFDDDAIPNAGDQVSVGIKARKAAESIRRSTAAR